MATEKTTEKTAEVSVKTAKKREEQKCSKQGCKRPYKAKAFCNVHYKMWRHGDEGFTKTRYKRCTKEACRKARTKDGGSLCAEHKAGGEAAPS